MMEGPGAWQAHTSPTGSPMSSTSLTAGQLVCCRACWKQKWQRVARARAREPKEWTVCPAAACHLMHCLATQFDSSGRTGGHRQAEPEWPAASRLLSYSWPSEHHQQTGAMAGYSWRSVPQTAPGLRGAKEWHPLFRKTKPVDNQNDLPGAARLAAQDEGGISGCYCCWRLACLVLGCRSQRDECSPFGRARLAALALA